MNKTLKKTLSIILAILMVLAIAPTVFADALEEKISFDGTSNVFKYETLPEGYSLSQSYEAKATDEDFSDKLTFTVTEPCIIYFGFEVYNKDQKSGGATPTPYALNYEIEVTYGIESTDWVDKNKPNYTNDGGDFEYYKHEVKQDALDTANGEIQMTLNVHAAMFPNTPIDELAQIGNAYIHIYTITKHTATFIANDEEVCSLKVVAGTEISAPETNPSKADYIFKGWAVKDTTDIVTFPVEMGDADVEYVAVFEACTHSFTDYIEIEAAKCGVAGKEEATCNNGCGKTDEKEIPALSHADADGDYICDNGCGYEFEKPVDPTPDEPADTDCDHICHKDGILGFFWKVISFLYRLFNIQQYCDCGVIHYEKALIG